MSLYTYNLFDQEHDACAIIALVRKDGIATHGNVSRVLKALDNMGHRTGEIDQEGDGTGIQTDIPRLIWSKKLLQAGMDHRLAFHPQFTVLHLMIKAQPEVQWGAKVYAIRQLLETVGFEVLLSQAAQVKSEVLGPRGKRLEPIFWQMVMIPQGRKSIAEQKSHEMHLRIEREYPDMHVVSFSQNSVIYKVRGDVRTLMNYFPELKHPDFKSAISLGHGRYSTNTESTHERAQMFSTLGHNGEINTITRLRMEAKRLGIQLVEQGSDSQDLDRMIETLMFKEDFTLMEAMEIMFPPIWSAIQKMDIESKEIYTRFRQILGMPAQGPAAIIARQGDEIVFSVDALGLRPLWFGESDKEFYASSEKGVINFQTMESDPVPIGPGEKKGLWLKRPISIPDGHTTQTMSGSVEIFNHQKVREYVTNRLKTISSEIDQPLRLNGKGTDLFSIGDHQKIPIAYYQAMGWKSDEWDDTEYFMKEGKEPIAATGYDGPLACLTDEVSNLPEFIKEKVAVVTNPSIDREREGDHFSLTSFLGAKPTFRSVISRQIQLDHPILLAGLKNDRLFSEGLSLPTLSGIKKMAEGHHTIIPVSLQSVKELPTVSDYRHKIKNIIQVASNESSSLIILDDREFFNTPVYAYDPYIFLAMLTHELDNATSIRGRILRLETSVILVSGQLRNTHDCMVALGLGANALAPYLMTERCLEGDSDKISVRLHNMMLALNSGIEKVISTLGIHDLSGYAPLFASIGLTSGLANELKITNALGDEHSGFGWAQLHQQLIKRKEMLTGEILRLKPDQHLYPKVWKRIAEVAKGSLAYTDYLDKIREVTKKTPVGIRHVLELNGNGSSVDACDVGIDGYAAPIYVSAMSFGSQGVISYSSYFLAAANENIVCMNGEGGELPEFLGKHIRNRGQQVASGRFGVNAKLLNSARFIEIKVGQGAKPGEGGHLPGFKVTAKIAEARHTSVGVDLISPSNNHDIYSIEDLAQLIEELKTVNPHAKIGVKIPAIPNIGPIATGIAKAQADVIVISGYDGGTGAARRHSLKYVGYPVEVALFESHSALVQSNLRSKVEVWADGGVKSTDDILTLMALGANRVGMATMAMVAIGCTICRDCNLGTCHVGITAHFPDKETAFAAGLPTYEPRDLDTAVTHLSHLIKQIGLQLAVDGKRLGFNQLQDLVGQNHLLKQTSLLDKIYAKPLTIPVVGAIITPTEDSDYFNVQKPKTGLSKMIAETLIRSIQKGHKKLLYRDDRVENTDRAVGAASSGELARMSLKGQPFEGEIYMDLTGGTIPGNGLGSFISQGQFIRVQGGLQDGAAKGASGGKMVILKGMNHNAKLVDGSVGKCFAYGAQNGSFFIQGTADSRTCIRLSGANVMFGKRLEGNRLNETYPSVDQADLKGFAFEYMTSGTVVVLGDPGPWMCSGMTGGKIYFRLYPELGFDVDALVRRLSSNAQIDFRSVNKEQDGDLVELLSEYRQELLQTAIENQLAEAERLAEDIGKIEDVFICAYYVKGKKPSQIQVSTKEKKSNG